METEEGQRGFGIAAAVVGALVVLALLAYVFSARLADSRAQTDMSGAETTGSVVAPAD